jgi:hypothetical protein
MVQDRCQKEAGNCTVPTGRRLQGRTRGLWWKILEAGVCAELSSHSAQEQAAVMFCNNLIDLFPSIYIA